MCDVSVEKPPLQKNRLFENEAIPYNSYSAICFEIFISFVLYYFLWHGSYALLGDFS